MPKLLVGNVNDVKFFAILVRCLYFPNIFGKRAVVIYKVQVSKKTKKDWQFKVLCWQQHVSNSDVRHLLAMTVHSLLHYPKDFFPHSLNSLSLLREPHYMYSNCISSFYSCLIATVLFTDFSEIWRFYHSTGKCKKIAF